jgi:predicted ribonuclease YlaK
MIALKDQMFENDFVISSVSLEELDKLKLTLSDAREVINLLNKFKTKYEVVIHTSEKEQIISSKGFQITNDLKILSDALYFEKNKKPDEMIFVTNDLNLQVIANLFLGEDCIESAVPA